MYLIGLLSEPGAASVFFDRIKKQMIVPALQLIDRGHPFSNRLTVLQEKMFSIEANHTGPLCQSGAMAGQTVGSARDGSKRMALECDDLTKQ